MTDDAGLAARLREMLAPFDDPHSLTSHLNVPIDDLRAIAAALTRPQAEAGETPETDAWEREWQAYVECADEVPTVPAGFERCRSMERQRNAALSELAALKHDIARAVQANTEEPHVRAVFDMLRRQKRQIEFTGGLEALALEDYQVGLLADLKPRPNCFFAYDPGDEFATLKSAADRLLAAGFTACSHRLRCYVLIGYPKDTFAAAEKRLTDILNIGFTPNAMLWQPETPSAEKHRPAPEWKRFQRRWLRPAIIHSTRHATGAV